MSSGFNSSAGLNVSGSKVFQKNVSLAPVEISSAASITIDASLGNVFYLLLGTSPTFNAPTNPTNGQQLTIIVEHSANNNVATWNAVWLFPGGVDAVLSTASGKIDLVCAVYHSDIGGWLTTFAKGLA